MTPIMLPLTIGAYSAGFISQNKNKAPQMIGIDHFLFRQTGTNSAIA
jgi:hypothetical protein